MKKLFYSLLILTLLSPLFVSANTFDVPGTDIILDIDEELWTVFTREDIKNETLLQEYGLDYNDFNNFFLNENVYLDAFTYLDEHGNTLELIVRKIKNDSDFDIKNSTEEEINNYFAIYAESYKISSYDFYINENNSYLFYRFLDNGVYIEEYYTVVNGYDYFITFRSEVEISDELLSALDSVVDGFVIEEVSENNNTTGTKAMNILLLIVFIIIVGSVIKSLSKNRFEKK